ncbi:MAG: glycosyltransferase family 4 protein [Candidatus Solibacter sp.]
MPAGRLVSVFGVNPSRIGGGEVFARALSSRLAARGWESVLVYESLPQGDVRRFLELPNVTFEVLHDAWKFAAGPAAGLAAILNRHPCDILHLYFTGFLSPYPWVARLRGARKVFFTDQGSHAEGYVATRRPAWKRLAARALNLPLNQVICISDYNVDCMHSRDMIDAARVTRIYNSVDLAAPHGDGAAFRARHGIPFDVPVIAQASWMIPEKGIADLVEAARIVIGRFPRARFLLAGEGKHRPEYMAMARDFGMDANFTWTGQVHNPVADGLYTAADIVCQVSRWEEAFGWVIAEAMAAARPLVVTRVGGIPELVEEGVTGFLVSPRAPAEIAARLIRLLEDPALRTHFGLAGRAAAERKFSLEDNLDALMRTYGFE